LGNHESNVWARINLGVWQEKGVPVFLGRGNDGIMCELPARRPG
jgi:hypothetical protein